MDIKDITAKVQDEIKSAAKDAVKETVDEMTGQMVQMIKEELVDQLALKKEQLIEKLTDEIVGTQSWGVKARDCLYVFALKVLDRIYDKIRADVVE